jgi:RNA polymerase sigma-70 factor (ECF subfamily)
MNSDSPATPAASAPRPVFVTTRWTQVLRARGSTPEARQALGELCAAYYQPVFRFLRCDGRDEDAARELTQEFFARLLAGGGIGGVDPGRGRFRSFLLGAVKHFLADMRAHDRRLKRGGGQVITSLDAPATGTDTGMGTAPGLQVADPAGLPPDSFFDRQWALALMDRAFATVEREFTDAGRLDQFQTLKPWLVGDVAALSQAEAGRHLGMSEGAVKVAVHRLRKRFREVIRAGIGQTVEEPCRVDEEMRYLVEVLSAG